MMSTKVCTTCKEELPYTSYYKDKSRSDGYSHICISCRKDYLKSPKGHITWKRKHVENRYGITLEEYNDKIQEGICEVCGSTDNICYDHCHSTGEFRGVLCNKCNRSIGMLGDTADTLYKVYTYLRNFEIKQRGRNEL